VRKMASDDASKPTKAAIDKAFAQVG
jgi:hypothetical protein